MGKNLIEIINLLAIITIVILPFLSTKKMGIVTLTVISVQVVLAFVVAFLAFSDGFISFTYKGSLATGEIPIRIDYLSAWFIGIISFTFFTGAWYGFQYMKMYRDQHSNLVLHATAFILAYTALIDICIVQNAIVFLVMWEIMTISSFITIIFEHYKKETLKAGINFFIQSHVAILFLTIAFIWVKVKTGSFDFAEISKLTAMHPAMGIGLFVFFFIGFAIKAGFVPFHTWLPLAHPVAPAHISGIMSGVIIKIGIFGILRMIVLIKTDYMTIGYFILIVSVITGVYGVSLAIIQHNLKRLLAYHSIENIGIIGIGIGLGCLGIGMENQLLLMAGFGGALLHTLNHSLFKSLLFYSAGNVYQATHTLNIESLGGLIKKIPQSTYLFLIGALAICGLPPFNGFVSEFLIYNGLFKGLLSNHFMFILVMLFSILAMVLIGGLALICFTKAFGIVFLGKARKELPSDKIIEKPLQVGSLYLIAYAITVIGVLPILFTSPLSKAAHLFQKNPDLFLADGLTQNLTILTLIGLYSLGFVALTVLALYIRRLIIKRRSVLTDATWGCAYVGDGKNMQYTASSFIRTFRKLAEPLFLIKKTKTVATGLYPTTIKQSTHPYDRLESALIDKPIYFFRKVLNRFVFLQNGNIQAYILYGFIFISTAIILPILISKFMVFIHFLNQL
ncbi:MAG: proton-conducting transporter membrane subunit [Prolixibacteraceae bacterium]